MQSKQNFNKVFRKHNLNISESFYFQTVNRPYGSNPKGNIPLLILETVPFGCEEPSWFKPKDGYFKTDLPLENLAFLPPNSTL